MKIIVEKHATLNYNESGDLDESTQMSIVLDQQVVGVSVIEGTIVTINAILKLADFIREHGLDKWDGPIVIENPVKEKEVHIV